MSACSGCCHPARTLCLAPFVPLFLCSAQEISRFRFRHIRKWMPANLRNINPGGEDCLDLQLVLDEGARDLRLDCGSAEMVDRISFDMQAAIKVRSILGPCLRPHKQTIPPLHRKPPKTPMQPTPTPLALHTALD